MDGQRGEERESIGGGEKTTGYSCYNKCDNRNLFSVASTKLNVTTNG